MNSTCELGRHSARALKPYQDYKDSGVPWLGEVPKHWKTERAHRLFRKMEQPVRENDEVVTCFRDGVVTLRKNRRVRGFTESLKEIGYQGVRRGDLVIHAMDAFAGAIGVSDSDGKGTPVYSVCSPRQSANAYYYAFCVREMARSEWILALAKGIRERSTDFRFKDFASQWVPLPPLPEQAAIVRFLDHADRRIRRYIRAQQQLIMLLEEQKQAITHRAVTRGLDPNVRLKPSGVEWLGDVPEHWRLPRLGALLRERGETNGDGQVSEVLSVLRERGVIPYAEKGNIGNKKSEDITRYKVVRPDDIVVNCMNVIIGSVGLSRYTGCLSPVYYVLTRRSERDHPRYLNAYFQTKPFQESLVRIGNGILAHRMRIPMELLKCEPFPRPPFEEQAAIVSFLDRATADLDAATTSAQRETSLLREYHTRFIADVVTGKLDVRAAAAGLPDEVKEPEPFDETSALIDGEEEPSDDLDAVPEEAEEV